MPATTWQEGDIAYLKPHTDFDRLAHMELITSNKMNPGATGHPCVILRVLPGDRVVVTTISAYGSGDHNNHAAPWISKRCYSRDQWWFRSFKGSECSSNNLKPLQLIPGQAMPKPKTSWLFIKNVYDVPLSVIGRFTKPRNGKLLKMAPDSLADLKKDIASRSPNYKSQWGFVNNPSHIKRGSTMANRRQPRALSEAPVVTSHKRPTATTTTTTNRPPTQAHPRNGSAPMRQSHPTPAPATSCRPATLLKPRSWADIASKSSAPTPLVKASAYKATSALTKASVSTLFISDTYHVSLAVTHQLPDLLYHHQQTLVPPKLTSLRHLHTKPNKNMHPLSPRT